MTKFTINCLDKNHLVIMDDRFMFTYDRTYYVVGLQCDFLEGTPEYRNLQQRLISYAEQILHITDESGIFI